MNLKYNPIPTAKVTEEKPSKTIWPENINRESFKDESYTKANVFHVDFLTSLYNDFSRSNLFKIEFDLVNEYQNNFEFISKGNQIKTEMMAKSFNMPSYDMGRQEIKRMGHRLLLPSTMNTGECQATFLCDDQYTQRKFLHSWFHKHVYDYDRSVYRKVAALKHCNIVVHQLDNKFNVVFSTKLKHAWPTSIGEIQLSHDSENQISEFPVTFAYSTYEILSPNADSKPEG